jgi:hypothetical protein
MRAACLARMATPVMMEMSRRFMGRPSVRSARCKFCAAATSSSGWRWRAEIEVDALKPGRAQAFIRAKREAMKAAGFSDQQLAALDGIAADIKRQQRFYATKVAGQSNTPQDLFKHMKETAGEGGSHLGFAGKVVAAKEGAENLHDWFHIPHWLGLTIGAPARLGLTIGAPASLGVVR